MVRYTTLKKKISFPLLNFLFNHQKRNYLRIQPLPLQILTEPLQALPLKVALKRDNFDLTEQSTSFDLCRT